MNLLKTFLNQKLHEEILYGEGSYLVTKKNRYLDLTGGLTGHAILGWTNPTVDKEIIKQLKKIPHVDYKNYYSNTRDELASILVSKKYGLSKVFFVGSSGAEGCEAAMKLSYQSFYISGKRKKRYFISRRQSYHGCTSDAISLGDRPNLNFYKPFFSKYRKKINEHNIFRHKKKYETESQYSLRSAKDLERMILKLGKENVCAFIAETSLGGLIGDVPPAKNYWKHIRKICDNYNIHLILDEVWCGTGTSGKYHNFEWDKIKPDLVFLSKTLAAGYGALSAVIIGEKVFNNLNKFTNQIQYSNTHQGHLLSVAGALAVQKIIKRKKFLEDIIKKGEYLRENLFNELSKNDFFLNVRGRGLRNSLEYSCKNQNTFGLTLSNVMKNKHKMIISGKWHRVCISPSLKIEKKNMEQFIDKFSKEFKTLSGKWVPKYYNNLSGKAFF